MALDRHFSVCWCVQFLGLALELLEFKPDKRNPYYCPTSLPVAIVLSISDILRILVPIV